MELIKINKETENALFKRKEIGFDVKSEIAPSYADVEKFISEKFSCKPDSIKIKTVKGKFGSHNFSVIANIYHSKADKDHTEPLSKKAKGEAKPKAKEASA